MDSTHTFVKICGISRLGDARTAIRAGADAVGFVFAKSPRRVSPSEARRIISKLHPSARKIGVFVDAPISKVVDVVEKSGIGGIQLQGTETQDYIDELKREVPSTFIAKVVRVTDRGSLAEASRYNVDALFLDTKDPENLTGAKRSIPLEWLGDLSRPVVLAGGLDPESVGEAVRSQRPWGVDVSRGVEESPGKKDHTLVRNFVRAVRRAEVMSRHPSLA